jgi:hypothetical protein
MFAGSAAIVNDNRRDGQGKCLVHPVFAYFSLAIAYEGKAWYRPKKARNARRKKD